jgi:hypothetical protein
LLFKIREKRFQVELGYVFHGPAFDRSFDGGEIGGAVERGQRLSEPVVREEMRGQRLDDVQTGRRLIKDSKMERPARFILAAMPVASRQEQEIAGLKNFVE